MKLSVQAYNCFWSLSIKFKEFGILTIIIGIKQIVAENSDINVAYGKMKWLKYQLMLLIFLFENSINVPTNVSQVVSEWPQVNQLVWRSEADCGLMSWHGRQGPQEDVGRRQFGFEEDYRSNRGPHRHIWVSPWLSSTG